MAKKLGKLMAVTAAATAVAAGVSYVLQYKTFHKDLDKDFREFEENDPEPAGEAAGEDSAPEAQEAPDSGKTRRSFASLISSGDEFKVAAKDMAHATKNVLKDAKVVFSETAGEAVSAAIDTAHLTIGTVKAKKDEFVKNKKASSEEEAAAEEGNASVEEVLEAEEENEAEAEPVAAQEAASDQAEDSTPAAEGTKEDEGFLDDDYVDEDGLFEYGRLEGGTPPIPAEAAKDPAFEIRADGENKETTSIEDDPS